MFELREKPEVMIIMPYFPRGNIVQAGIREESRLVTAVGQILDCLTFLHGRGVTHRDIKPDNVLVELRPHFKVVLSDFGMSKTVTETTWLQTFAERSSTSRLRCSPSARRRMARQLMCGPSAS